MAVKKVLIYPYGSLPAWSSEFFPERSFCTLTLAGKEYAEYLVDIAARLGFEEVLLLDYNFDTDFQEQLGDGSRWSLKLDYRGAGLRRSVHAILDENHAFTGDDDVAVCCGAVLPDIDSMEQLLADTEPVPPGELEPGMYLRRGGQLLRSRVPLRRMETLKDYFELNFQLLSSPGQHVLPGYLVENGVHTGMNVMILPGCEIKPPVLLCDNICLERGCSLDQGVIVGRNVVVDRDNSLKHSIILGNTFVGAHMEIHGKIVDSGRIIDPEAEVCVVLEDQGVSSDLRRYQKPVEAADAVEYLLALLLAFAGLIPFALGKLVGLGYWSKLWYCKLSMDCYPRLWLVLIGKCPLIGTKGKRGVYRISEALSIGRDRYQRSLDEAYFAHHRDSRQVFKAVLRAIINRMFMTYDVFQNAFELH